MKKFLFSNFQPARVTCSMGITYPTTEHAYQAEKTLNARERLAIAQLPTPGQAKRAGRKVTLRPDWNEARIPAMTRLLKQKFAPGTRHAQALLATGSEEIVEWNQWHDKTWGRCTCQRCQGEGQNQLGEVLMRIRANLQE